jgi:hypothetical protein
MKTFLIRQPRAFLLITAALWFGIYKTLELLTHILVDVLPVERCRDLYDAPASPSCNTLLELRHGDGCVFCFYGSMLCPPVQSECDGYYRMAASLR